MQTETITSLMQQTLLLVLWLSAPVLLAAAVVGLLWAVIQAVTQLQDSASAFVVKLVAVAVVIAVLSGWTGAQLERFTDNMFSRAQSVKR